MTVYHPANIELHARSASSFNSTISITDQNGTETANYPITGASKLDLGTLDDLKDSVMTVTTTSPDNSLVSYDILYNGQIVKRERTFFGFSFHFCPFFPFCDWNVRWTNLLRWRLLNNKQKNMPGFDDRKSKSFDVVLDTVKLLITLSTAIIGFAVSGVLIPDDKHPLDILKSHALSITLALISLGLCVFFSLSTILKMAGLLGSDKRIKDDDLTINDRLTRLLFFFSLLSFFLGILITGVLVFKVLGTKN
jgi:hypothetical protein